MFDSSESGGVGEGQGTTDVSDQIENQDQVLYSLNVGREVELFCDFKNLNCNVNTTTKEKDKF